MRQIINGLVYDTETAEELFDASNNLPTSDFRYVRQTVYRTPNGRYFVEGRGGAMSHFGVACGDDRRGGDGIRVIGATEARRWAEKELTGEEYEAIFGPAEPA